MTEQTGLDVLKRQRCFEQRVILQIDLPDREVIRGAPVSVHLVEQIGRYWIGHGRLPTFCGVPTGQFRSAFGSSYSGSLSADRLMWSSHLFKPAVSALSDVLFLDGGHAGKTPADCE
jgi:hypothetical protein